MANRPADITRIPAPHGSRSETRMESLPRRRAGVGKLRPKTGRAFTRARAAKIATKVQTATAVTDAQSLWFWSSLYGIHLAASDARNGRINMRVLERQIIVPSL